MADKMRKAKESVIGELSLKRRADASMEQYSYTAFAYVYDELMDNVPYDEWARYLTGLLKEYGVSEGLVCELGCGTGQMTRRLAAAGYDMIGIDLSADMLNIAREREDEEACVSGEEEEGRDTDGGTASVLYLQQDMRSFELYGTVSAIVSICDSMNYITSEEDMLAVFRLVNNYLDKGGVFIFDLNTEYKYRELLGDTTIAENREEISFIWENLYDEERRLNEYCLTLFTRVWAEDGEETTLYEKQEEVHLQRAYSLEEIKGLLAKAGLEFLAAYDVLTHEIPGVQCERMYIIAGEGYQSGKAYR